MLLCSSLCYIIMSNSAMASGGGDAQGNDPESSGELTDHSREHTSQKTLSESSENQSSTIEQIIKTLKQQLKTLWMNNHIIELWKQIKHQQILKEEKHISINQSQQLFFQMFFMKLFKLNFYYEKFMRECTQWFDHIKNLLDTNEAQEFLEKDKVNWAVNYFRDTLTTD